MMRSIIFFSVGKSILLGFFLFLFPSLAFSQHTISAAGGEATGTGGTVSYSIGQLFHTTLHSEAEGSIHHGVQQPYEIFIITGTEAPIALSISIYPNPTTGILSLKTDSRFEANLSYRVYDINFRLLESSNIHSSETPVILSNYAEGTYFIQVSQGILPVKTFKIIKTD
jgi:hypothetical protein